MVPEAQLSRALDWYWNEKSLSLNQERTEKSKSKRVPFVLTCHLSLNCLHKIITDNTDLLYMNEEGKNLFLPEPMVSFRRARKLGSYDQKAKSYSLHRKVGSEKFAKSWCEICDNMTDTDTFTSTVIGESFKINYQLNYDERCVIYLLTCKRCQKQYTGETMDDFRYRWNNYKSNSRKFDRKESCMQEHLIDTLVVQVTWDSLMMYQLH